MAKKITLSEVLANGTPKQKALLVIKHEEEEITKGVTPTLTDKDVKAIIASVKKNPEEAKEYNRYIKISEVFAEYRFNYYSLQENIQKLIARILLYLRLWEQAEKEVELFNSLLAMMSKEGTLTPNIESFIYKKLAQWHRCLPIRKKEGLPEVEVDITIIRRLLDGEIAIYKNSLGVAKAYVEAAEIFLKREKAAAFVPDDIKRMLAFFKSSHTEIPELYRRDSYLQLLKEKGANNREVRFREKYAIFPAYEEVETYNSENTIEMFDL